MSPRILFIDHTAQLGGAELYLLDVVRPLKECAHVVLFEHGPLQGVLEKEGIQVTVLGGGHAFMRVQRKGGLLQAMFSAPSLLAQAWKLKKLARSFDVIFANSQKALLVGSIAARMAHRPLVWSLHDLLVAEHFSRWHRYIDVFFANAFARKVIVNSKATRDAFVSNGGKVENTHIVYNGLDSRRFTTAYRAEDSDLRERLSIYDAPLLGVFGRLAPWKGQHVMLELMTRLRDTHVLLVGDAVFEGDREYEQQLRSMADRLGIANRVHFLGFRYDVPELMRLVDIVVHTSVSPEPFGRVIVEGMFAGKPVIATNAGGVQEIIEHRKTGWLVPPGDVDALTKTVRYLQKFQQETILIAEAGQASAVKRFSIALTRKQVESIIEEVVCETFTFQSSEASVASG